MAPYRAGTRAALEGNIKTPGAIETVSLQFMHNKGFSPQILIPLPTGKSGQSINETKVKETIRQCAS